jgi:hypothetical protein
MDMLKGLGIAMQEVAERLLTETLQLFEDAFDKLLKAVEKQSRSAGPERSIADVCTVRTDDRRAEGFADGVASAG